MNAQTLVNGSAGVIGAIFTYFYGGMTAALEFLLIVIAVDIVTGIIASVREGTGLSSAVGAIGLAKKGLILLVVLLAHRIDVLMGTDVVMTGAIYFYIANELISITENYGRVGLPLPDGLKRIIAVLKGRADNGGQNV